MRHPTILNEADILSGDVLLCFSSQAVEEDIEVRGYCHAAICLSDQKVLDASEGAGVAIDSIASLWEEFDHIAVLRDLQAWDSERRAMLEAFAKAKVGVPFNRTGMLRLPTRKEAHRDSVMSDLVDYFEGKNKPRNVSGFFCSQLVAETLIHVGIIDESAAVVLAPSITSPKTIAEDRIYGQFLGFLLRYPTYNVPSDDRFRRAYG
jgi:hypothetical protein